MNFNHYCPGDYTWSGMMLKWWKYNGTHKNSGPVYLSNSGSQVFFENHHPQRFLRNELQSLQPWGLFNLSGMFSKLSYSAWFSSSRLVSPPRALGLCMCQMRILWFHVKPSVRKAYIFKEYMYENKTLFFYTLEIFSFGGVECRKSKYPLERLARRPPQLSSFRLLAKSWVRMLNRGLFC